MTENDLTDRGITKVLLIDLENCPHHVQQLQKHLKEFSQVVICYAQSGAKIPLDWLMPLSATVHANQLNIFKMTSGGKNAADFGICFFAGALMQQLPAETHFVIVSNDTDLDHVVQAVIPKLKTSGKRLRSKLKRVDEWAGRVRNVLPLRQLWALFQAKLRGHIQYYGVSFNTKALNTFVYQATRILFRHLNRRSQRKSFNWEQFARFQRAYPLPSVRIRHALF